MDKKAWATRTLYKFYRILANREEIRLELNRKIKHCGEVSFWPDAPAMILINPDKRTKGGIMSTIIHELLHIVYDQEPEIEILRLEKIMYKNLTDRQLTNLFKRAAYIVTKKKK